MKIQLKYFGMLAESLQKNEEIIEENAAQTIEIFKIKIEERYPQLKKADYRIAVNQTLVNPDFEIKSDCEIALLPPFSGG